MPYYRCFVCDFLMEADSKPKECGKCGSNVILKTRIEASFAKTEKSSKLLYLRENYVPLLLEACRTLREKLIVRYMVFNGLSSMELANARIEHLDPVDLVLYLPRRHWKKNETTDIDAETVQMQIVYSGSRKKGPLIRNIRTGGHLSKIWIWAIVKRVASRTTIPNADAISPLVLKRTYARLFLRTEGNTIGDLQRSFGHKHLWSTAHYLRFILDDAKVSKSRMMSRLTNRKERARLEA